MNKDLINTKEVVVVELPNNNIDMAKFAIENKKDLKEVVVDNIQCALSNKWDAVEVFSFRETNFVVVINFKDFKESLQDAFDFGMENEHYEICAKAKKAMDRLEQSSFVMKYKIQPKNNDVKTETSPKKATKRSKPRSKSTK